MEKRVVVFLILALAIILGYDYLLKQMGLVPQSSQSSQESEDRTAQGLSAERPSASVVPGPGTTEPPAPPPPETAGASTRLEETPTAPVLAEQGQEVTTDLFRAVFTNRGAEIKSWELTRYSTGDHGNPKPIQLMYAGGKFSGPLAIRTADPAVSKQLREGLYHVERDFSTLDAAHPTGHLTFTYHHPETGLRVTKQLT
ncbi:MAG: hypothetical protein EPO64_13130, partial [Nitrospirae bacterium]